jgi:hypothetical protein
VSEKVLNLRRYQAFLKFYHEESGKVKKVKSEKVKNFYHFKKKEKAKTFSPKIF